MTTIATVAGHFPLTLVSGPGAAARNSIGIVLVGGMAIGTIFTLFVVPSVYVLVAKDHTKDRARQAQLAADAGTIGAAVMVPARVVGPSRFTSTSPPTGAANGWPVERARPSGPGEITATIVWL